VKHHATVTVTALFELVPEDLGGRDPQETARCLERLAEYRVRQWFPNRRNVTTATATIHTSEPNAIKA
jgi:hypothetical protein